MGVLDRPLRSVALKLIDKFGKLVTLTTPGGVYDEASGDVTGGPVAVQVRAIVEDYPALQTSGGSREGGDAILRGDKKVTVAAQALAGKPSPTQTVTVDQETFGIIKVDAVFSGDEAAIYVLQCRA